MSGIGAAPRAPLSASGAPTRAAASVNSARPEASRRNGAKSRGPKTAEGKARSAQNALKHGMRAVTHVVLPDEAAAEFDALEAALLDELAPVGALQVVLAGRVAVAAWRLARADRMEVELFAGRRWDNRGVGVALIRDGNGTRSFETLLRYRGAAMAEFMRALRTLKALQAEQAAAIDAPVARPTNAPRVSPNEPERLMEYVLPEPPVAGCALHEAAATVPTFEQTYARTGAAEASRMPNQPERALTPNAREAAPAPNEPEPVRQPRAPETRHCQAGPQHGPNAPEPGRRLHDATAPSPPDEPELRTAAHADLRPFSPARADGAAPAVAATGLR